MARFIAYFTAIAAVVLVTIGATSYENAPYIPNSAVRIETDGSIGTGVFIGHHVIITAAHVVIADKDGIVDIKTQPGKLFKGEVLWTAKDYDIAAVRVDDIEGIEPSMLSCSVPAVGEEVVIVGNPMGRYFLTSWGKISGKPEKVSRWRSLMTVDASIAPGNSGGPAYNKYGEVVGIMVNGMLAPIGFGASLTGFQGAVPAQTVCRLLGRA